MSVAALLLGPSIFVALVLGDQQTRTHITVISDFTVLPQGLPVYILL